MNLMNCLSPKKWKIENEISEYLSKTSKISRNLLTNLELTDMNSSRFSKVFKFLKAMFTCSIKAVSILQASLMILNVTV